jgi:hypothetical protein
MCPDATSDSRFFFKITQEVLLRYMICVGLVHPSVVTLRISILISNADLLAEGCLVTDSVYCVNILFVVMVGMPPYELGVFSVRNSLFF